MNKSDLGKSSWSRAMIVWFDMNLAQKLVLERLAKYNSDGLWPVYSYLP